MGMRHQQPKLRTGCVVAPPPIVLGAVGAGSAFDLSPQRPLRARRDENSITLCRKKGPSDGRRLRVLGGCSSPISQRGVTLEPGGDALTVTPQPLVGGLLFARVLIFFHASKSNSAIGGTMSFLWCRCSNSRSESGCNS